MHAQSKFVNIERISDEKYLASQHAAQLKSVDKKKKEVTLTDKNEEISG